MNNKYKILFVEDEENIQNFVAALLEANDYRVITTDSCAMARTLYSSHIPDLVILDLGLPDGDGGDFLLEMRKEDATPVIVLSARCEEREKVRLLDMGANDYITKPFGSEELLARVRAALRQSRRGSGDARLPGKKFVLDDLTINYDARQVFISGVEIRFTQTEYNILAFLSENAGKMMTYAMIIKAVWREIPDEASVKRLQVNMANIRKKLGANPGEASYVVNELGVGYRMNC
jgi:two-component system KDP operon response regulator KdpE